MARMSPPAQKARSPSPRSTIALTAGSCSQSSSWRQYARIIGRVSAFSAFGRFSVAMPIAPRRSNRMSEVMMLCRGRSILLAQQAPRDDHPHDLVGAFEDAMDTQIAQVALDGIL